MSDFFDVTERDLDDLLGPHGREIYEHIKMLRNPNLPEAHGYQEIMCAIMINEAEQKLYRTLGVEPDINTSPSIKCMNNVVTKNKLMDSLGMLDKNNPFTWNGKVK